MIKNLLIACIAIIMCNLSAVKAQEEYSFKDTDGEHINAHGGGVLIRKGTYYWYGEVKKKENHLLYHLDQDVWMLVGYLAILPKI